MVPPKSISKELDAYCKIDISFLATSHPLTDTVAMLK
jgi:hypothetical protein